MTDTIKEAALLPCPFCGGEAYEDKGRVECESCCATLPTDQWNHRTISPEQRRAIYEEELAEEMAKLGVEPFHWYECLPNTRDAYRIPLHTATQLQAAVMGEREMLEDARLELDMLRQALEVSYEPHQTLSDRLYEAAELAGKRTKAAQAVKETLNELAEARVPTGLNIPLSARSQGAEKGE